MTTNNKIEKNRVSFQWKLLLLSIRHVLMNGSANISLASVQSAVFINKTNAAWTKTRSDGGSFALLRDICVFYALRLSYEFVFPFETIIVFHLEREREREKQRLSCISLGSGLGTAWQSRAYGLVCAVSRTKNHERGKEEGEEEEEEHGRTTKVWKLL